MKKKVIIFLSVITLFVFTVSGYNIANSVHCFAQSSNVNQTVTIDDKIVWFTPTGIVVESFDGTKYDILKDRNGWLYYSHMGKFYRELEPVIDTDGNRTKDLSLFDVK